MTPRQEKEERSVLTYEENAYRNAAYEWKGRAEVLEARAKRLEDTLREIAELEGTDAWRAMFSKALANQALQEGEARWV